MLVFQELRSNHEYQAVEAVVNFVRWVDLLSHGAPPTCVLSSAIISLTLIPISSRSQHVCTPIKSLAFSTATTKNLTYILIILLDFHGACSTEEVFVCVRLLLNLMNLLEHRWLLFKTNYGWQRWCCAEVGLGFRGNTPFHPSIMPSKGLGLRGLCPFHPTILHSNNQTHRRTVLVLVVVHSMRRCSQQFQDGFIVSFLSCFVNGFCRPPLDSLHQHLVGYYTSS